MAVILYRRTEAGELETCKVAPRSLRSHLDEGWALTDEAAPGNPEPAGGEVAADDELDRLRAMGKEAGIKNAGKMGAERLKEELGLE